MNRSPEIHELASALAKAQGAIEDAEKDRTNPHFKSRYADLASVREAIRLPLSSNEIAYVQGVRTVQGGVEIETMLMHSSGQFIGETLFIPVPNMTAQSIGSATSYGKRYALMGMVGVAASEDDDDGNAAMPQRVVFENGGMHQVPDKQPAVSSRAINLGRELRACKSLADLAAFRDTDEFKDAWKSMPSVDRAHITNVAEKRKAEMEAVKPETVEG